LKYEKTSKNIDIDTVNNFSDEWKRYDQSHLSDAELKSIFDDYFSIFPWDLLSKDAIGFDMGCGTGRWAKFVAPKVGLLHCIDPSDAIDVAKKVLKDNTNIAFHKASTEICE
jgi:ubiquinone/menaquinone biosynthesis C-methylase UbiE